MLQIAQLLIIIALMRKIFSHLRKCWAHFAGYKFLFAVVLVLKLIRMSASLALPLIFSGIISGVTEKNYENILFLLIATAAIIVFELLISFTCSRIETRISKGVNYRTRQNTMQKFLSLPPHKLTDFNEGKLFALVFSDSLAISSYVFTVINSFMSIINIVSIGIIIFMLNWQLALIALTVYPAIYTVNFFYSKKIKSIAQAYYKKSDSFISFLRNLISSLNELKNRNAGSNVRTIYDDKLLDLKQIAINQDTANQNNSLIIGMLGAVQYLLILFFGVLFIIAEKISLGNFIAFNSYSRSFSSSLNVIVNLNASLQPVIVVLERLENLDRIYFDFLEEENNKKIDFPAGECKFSFKNVSLTLADKCILDNLNLEINGGAVTGLVGKNGTGKTTIANLIVNKYIPSSGVIELSGVDLQKYKYSDLQRNIVFVKQTPDLLHMTILENLLLFLSSKSYDMEKIEAACADVGMLEDIKKMPLGFNTLITDHVNLSIGQAKKLQLARAIITDSSVIIFDEPTAHLDDGSKKLILDLIPKLKDKTIIYITHYKDELQLCNTVHRLE